MARPHKLDEDKIARVVEALRAGNYMETAAAYAGISKSILYKWLADGREVRQKVAKGGIASDLESKQLELLDSVEKARAEAEVRNVHLIQQAAQGGTWQAAAWFLERSHPGKWGRREKVEMSGPDGGPITLTGLADLMRVKGDEDEE
jgi:transposase